MKSTSGPAEEVAVGKKMELHDEALELVVKLTAGSKHEGVQSLSITADCRLGFCNGLPVSYVKHGLLFKALQALCRSPARTKHGKTRFAMS